MWVGTRTGSLARRNGDAFESVPMQVARGIIGRQGIATDRQGRLYLATDRGLVTGARDSGQLQFRLLSSPDEEVTTVYIDGADTVWYSCGLSLCMREDGHEVETGKNQGLPNERWETILGDLDGNLCVRSQHSLYCRRAGTGRFLPRPGLPESKNTFPTLALDPSGRLLVPTDLGLARETESGWEMVSVDDGLSTNDISAVFQDREGSIWLGLLGSGLARWLGYDEWQNWSDRQGLSRSSVWSIARDAGGTLWVGTQFGLNYGQMQNGRLVWKPKPIPGRDMIRSLASGMDGSLWIGAGTGGLTQMDPRTGQSRQFGAREGLENSEVFHVMVDHRGHVWVSTRHGLYQTAQSARMGSPVLFERMLPEGNHGRRSFRDDGRRPCGPDLERGRSGFGQTDRKTMEAFHYRGWTEGGHGRAGRRG